MAASTKALQRTTYRAVFGRVLADHRRALRLDQAEVATRVGVSQPTYSRMESGDVAVPVDVLRAVSSVFRVHYGALIEAADEAVEALRRLGVEVLDERVRQKGDLATALLAGAALAAMIALALKAR